MRSSLPSDQMTHPDISQSLVNRSRSQIKRENDAVDLFERLVLSTNNGRLSEFDPELKKNTFSPKSREERSFLDRNGNALAVRQTDENNANSDSDSKEKKADADESPSDAATPDATKNDASESNTKSSSASSLLKQSRKDMKSLTSIQAKLDETISFGPKRFKAAGMYTQRGLRLRLEYQLKLGASDGELLEVCDGQVLWTQQTIDNEVQVTRRDVQQILETAKNLPRSDSMVLNRELGLGGLQALLASLEETMTFKLGDNKSVESREFTLLEGRWNKEYLKIWSNGSTDPNAQLPPYVPDRVRIYMEHIRHNERTVYFPTRIVYLKKANPEKSIYRPIVTLEFTKIVLDGPVADDEFQYSPREGVTPVDLTQEYLQQLKPPPSRKSSSPSAGKSMP